MRGTRLFFLYLLMAGSLLLTAGCNVPGEKADEKAATTVQDVKGPAEDIRSLSCFKCHPYDKFNGIFPHDLHRSVGLHCTQCHLIKSHKGISLNRETCTKCHNLETMRMKTSDMPVTFNHGLHSNMFGCGDCHMEVFPMKLNARKIVMDDIFKGRSCGKCHNGGTAFSPTDCGKCHKG